MSAAPLPLRAASITFGTDGWRGVLGVDITVERLLPVAVAAAQELAHRAPADLDSRTVVIGYDRRFLAPELADGAPVRGESIPIRLFLSGFDALTPTFRNVNSKFSVKYFLNLVLIDEEDRRYFKQQEITLYRK